MTAEENAGITASEEEVIQEDIADAVGSPANDIDEHGGDEGEEVDKDEAGGEEDRISDDDEGRNINPIETRLDSEVGQNEDEEQ
eukprot:CAMPEP_0170505484 /NCGR_PEP_ID=MMETSP0208-20121228/51102_1 /TAXON_ID=197538 /ORGANISM="Strombidium inclinatum, Strain S3" /LENGTH=83 /DNA_ID=CAMNT_0010786385 /DNA_START=256 /DNA_END=507 /DNA_ORIENTATION=-